MNRIIAVIGYPIAMFNDVIVPYIVNQQPSPVAARLRLVTWLEDGTYIYWVPWNESTHGRRAWKIYCNIGIGQGFFDRVVRGMLTRDNAGIEWFDAKFNPVDPPQWDRRN